MWNISAKAEFAATNVSPVTHGWGGQGAIPHPEVLSELYSDSSRLLLSRLQAGRGVQRPASEEQLHAVPQRAVHGRHQLRPQLQEMPKLQKYGAPISAPAPPEPPVSITVLEHRLFFLLLPPFSATPEHDVLVSPCERHRNAVCRCEDGYYRSNIDSETYECLKCRRCGPNEKESQKCESGSSPGPLRS